MKAILALILFTASITAMAQGNGPVPAYLHCRVETKTQAGITVNSLQLALEGDHYELVASYLMNDLPALTREFRIEKSDVMVHEAYFNIRKATPVSSSVLGEIEIGALVGFKLRIGLGAGLHPYWLERAALVFKGEKPRNMDIKGMTCE
jgi:hypothetical protein